MDICVAILSSGGTSVEAVGFLERLMDNAIIMIITTPEYQYPEGLFVNACLIVADTCGGKCVVCTLSTWCVSVNWATPKH
jgi:hypothetical protein